MRGKVMVLIDPSNGTMECPVCGYRVQAMIKPGGGFYRGAWQCPDGCTYEQAKAAKAEKRAEAHALKIRAKNEATLASIAKAEKRAESMRRYVAKHMEKSGN